MGRELFNIDPIKKLDVGELNKTFSVIARHLRTISGQLAAIQGLDGQTVKLHSDLDLQGKTIRNVASVQSSNENPLASLTFAGQLNTLTKKDILDPGDAPANVDALRDDITENVIPSIEDKFVLVAEILASIADQINQGVV